MDRALRVTINRTGLFVLLLGTFWRAARKRFPAPKTIQQQQTRALPDRPPCIQPAPMHVILGIGRLQHLGVVDLTQTIQYYAAVVLVKEDAVCVVVVVGGGGAMNYKLIYMHRACPILTNRFT